MKSSAREISVPCVPCHGTGQLEGMREGATWDCPSCRGTGEIVIPRSDLTSAPLPLCASAFEQEAAC